VNADGGEIGAKKASIPARLKSNRVPTTGNFRGSIRADEVELVYINTRPYSDSRFDRAVNRCAA